MFHTEPMALMLNGWIRIRGIAAACVDSDDGVSVSTTSEVSDGANAVTALSNDHNVMLLNSHENVLPYPKLNATLPRCM